MKLTLEMIRAGRGSTGAFTLNQLRLLGVPLPERGWPEKGASHDRY